MTKINYPAHERKCFVDGFSKLPKYAGYALIVGVSAVLLVRNGAGGETAAPAARGGTSGPVPKVTA